MITVLNDAFRDNPFQKRVFPPSLAAEQRSRDWFDKNLPNPESYFVVAEDATASSGEMPEMAGWARWVRCPSPSPDSEPAPPPVFTEDMYPHGGDQALAVRFFKANYDAKVRHVGDQSAWFLSTIVVGNNFQRRGVGSLLMRYGVEKADEEGWVAYVNASPEGKTLYEKFGFRTMSRSDFGDAISSEHMMREVKGVLQP